MFLHVRPLREEILFYEELNKMLAVEDLLCEIMGHKKLNENKIKENDRQIERISFSISGLCM